MVFQGEVLSIGALLERAQTALSHAPGLGVGVRHTAASNAVRSAELLASGVSPEAGWRFGVLQTLDDYTSTLRRGGAKLDAAFAALADHLAERDGWTAPIWAADSARRTEAWYPAVPAIFRREAEQDSPRAFRQRGIFITERSLSRA